MGVHGSGTADIGHVIQGYGRSSVTADNDYPVQVEV